MRSEELGALVEQATDGDLPRLVGDLASALAVSLARLATRPTPADSTVSLDPDRPLCVGVDRVADLLGLPTSAVYDLLRRKRLPGYKEGKYWLIPVAALEAHVRSRLEEAEGRTYRSALKGGAIRAVGRG